MAQAHANMSWREKRVMLSPSNLDTRININGKRSSYARAGALLGALYHSVAAHGVAAAVMAANETSARKRRRGAAIMYVVSKTWYGDNS